MNDLGLVMRAEEWPFGLRCASCNVLIEDGQRYSEQLDSMAGDTPIVLIVCVSCAFSSPTPNKTEGGE